MKMKLNLSSALILIMLAQGANAVAAAPGQDPVVLTIRTEFTNAPPATDGSFTQNSWSHCKDYAATDGNFSVGTWAPTLKYSFQKFDGLYTDIDGDTWTLLNGELVASSADSGISGDEIIDTARVTPENIFIVEESLTVQGNNLSFTLLPDVNDGLESGGDLVALSIGSFAKSKNARVDIYTVCLPDPITPAK